MAVTAASGWARPRPAVETVLPPTPYAVAQRSGVSLEQAVAIATRRYSGRVVRAETVTRNGRAVHEIRILADDGRVRTVHVDAQSGELR